MTSLFAHAIAVEPSKDTWWSTDKQTWKNAGVDTETRNRLQAVVATLSRGPVTPSDKIGSSDRDLIMRSCMADG